MQIEVFNRPDGKDGYVVGWAPKWGTHRTGPPIDLARFESSAIGRREAMMFKNGIVQGIRLAGNVLENAVSDGPR